MTANMHAVKSVHSMGSHDNADLILCVMRFVSALLIANILLNKFTSHMHVLCFNFDLCLLAIKFAHAFYTSLGYRDLSFKLWGLHYSGVIHGNLKPQNVLVFEGECMLTSIINDCKYRLYII